MLAERIRAVGIVVAAVSVAIVSFVAAVPEGTPVEGADVRVAMVESVDPVREVQFVVKPVKRRDVFCRYPTSKLKGLHRGTVAAAP